MNCARRDLCGGCPVTGIPTANAPAQPGNVSGVEVPDTGGFITATPVGLKSAALPENSIVQCFAANVTYTINDKSRVRREWTHAR